MNNCNELISIAAIIEILGVSRPTAINLVRNRVIPGIRVGGQYRIPRRNVERFLSEQGLEPDTVEELMRGRGHNAPTSAPARGAQPDPVEEASG